MHWPLGVAGSQPGAVLFGEAQVPSAGGRAIESPRMRGFLQTIVPYVSLCQLSFVT